MKILLSLIQNFFRGATKKNGASVRVLAVRDEGVVLVTNLPNLKKTRIRAHVRIFEIFRTIDNGGPAGTSDTFVRCLSKTPQGSDAVLDEPMLRFIFPNQKRLTREEEGEE